MPAVRIARYLKHPARQPEYRRERTHSAFLRTIEAPPEEIKMAISEAWGAESPLDVWPKTRMADNIEAILRRTEDGTVLHAVR
jgi:lipoate-protein ligase A